MLDDELRAIVHDIVITLFAEEPRCLQEALPPYFDLRAIDAQVVLAGAFQGVLRGTFSEQLARTLAGVMLAQPLERSSADDLRDVTGELINIAAGNLKAVLPSPCRLSLPSVQAHATTPADDVAPLASASFELFGEPLSLALFGR
ncbi:MAG: chemotaxis protein CheX [Polyangiales bacterium]